MYSPDLADLITDVAIPLGQGQVFNKRLSMTPRMLTVAIPLGQGQVFNEGSGFTGQSIRRNPFGSGTGF